MFISTPSSTPKSKTIKFRKGFAGPLVIDTMPDSTHNNVEIYKTEYWKMSIIQTEPKQLIY